MRIRIEGFRLSKKLPRRVRRRSGEKDRIMFCRDMCVAKHTSQAACVRVVRLSAHKECAKQTATPSVEKPQRGFSTV